MQYYEVSPTTIVRADAGSFSYASHEELVPGIIVTIPVGKISHHCQTNYSHCMLG